MRRRAVLMDPRKWVTPTASTAVVDGLFYITAVNCSSSSHVDTRCPPEPGCRSTVPSCLHFLMMGLMVVLGIPCRNLCG
jgi:hypothetical protein